VGLAVSASLLHRKIYDLALFTSKASSHGKSLEGDLASFLNWSHEGRYQTWEITEYTEIRLNK
jgi:hypothetical protein